MRCLQSPLLHLWGPGRAPDLGALHGCSLNIGAPYFAFGVFERRHAFCTGAQLGLSIIDLNSRVDFVSIVAMLLNT